jgi:thioesterase domain-containing protein
MIIAVRDARKRQHIERDQLNAVDEEESCRMDLETAKQMTEGGIKFVSNTGLRVLELRRGYVKCLMPLSGNENHIGTMYAGALFTLAEIPGGALYLSIFDASRYFAVVKQMDLHFLKPARSDVTVCFAMDEERISAISAVAARHGKADFALAGRLTTEDGTLVAQSRGLYQIRALQPSSN